MRTNANLLLLGLIGFAPAVALSQPLYKDYRPPQKIEAGLLAGFIPPPAGGTSTYDDAWSEGLLKGVNETTEILTAPRAGFFLDGFFSYDFHPNAGIKLDIGYAAARVPNGADFGFAWTWADGSSFRNDVRWSGSGRLATIPISLDFVGRAEIGRVTVALEAGPTLFVNSFRAESSIGYGITRILEIGGTTTQYIDAIRVGLTIPRSSWTAAGANVGAEIRLPVSSRAAFRAEIRYFACPRKELAWDFVTGVSDGLFFSDSFAELRNISFSASDVAYIKGNGLIAKLPVGPSLFVASAGIAVGLGDW